MEKPKGTYITMEAPNLIVPDEDYHRGISQVLAHHLKELLHLEKEKSILVVAYSATGRSHRMHWDHR